MGEPSSQPPTVKLLEQIAGDLSEIKEILSSFTDDGFPLRQSIPTPELLASLVSAAALLSRSDPRINGTDLQQRIDAAQVIGSRLIQVADAFRHQTERIHLERLHHESGHLP